MHEPHNDYQTLSYLQPSTPVNESDRSMDATAPELSGEERLLSVLREFLAGGSEVDYYLHSANPSDHTLPMAREIARLRLAMEDYKSEEDTARLDWLAKERHSLMYYGVDPVTQIAKWDVGWGVHTTPRLAIDVAMDDDCSPKDIEQSPANRLWHEGNSKIREMSAPENAEVREIEMTSLADCQFEVFTDGAVTSVRCTHMGSGRTAIAIDDTRSLSVRTLRDRALIEVLRESRS
jgi:hypothetical protein